MAYSIFDFERRRCGGRYTYGLDLTKNVCEVFGTTGYINTAYTPNRILDF